MEDSPNNNLEQIEQIDPKAQLQSRGEMTMQANGEVENEKHNEEDRAGESIDDKSERLRKIHETRDKYDKELHKYDRERSVIYDLMNANMNSWGKEKKIDKVTFGIIDDFLCQQLEKYPVDEDGLFTEDYAIQQGVNIITDEDLQDKWIMHIRNKLKEERPASLGARSVLWMELAALKGMEMIEDGKDFDEIKEKVFPPVDMPYAQLPAARMIANLSPKGEEFAKYAGIDDLPRENSIDDYYKIVESEDGRIRGPFNNVL